MAVGRKEKALMMPQLAKMRVGKKVAVPPGLTFFPAAGNFD
jgi:hypothetical protein